jgi:hypothetical protein
MWESIRNNVNVKVGLCIAAIVVGGVLMWSATRPSKADAKEGEAKHFMYQNAEQQQAAELDR